MDRIGAFVELKPSMRNVCKILLSLVPSVI